MRKADARLSSKNDTKRRRAQHLVLFLYPRRAQRAQRHLPNGNRTTPRRPATASRTWAFPWYGLASWSQPIVFISLPVLWQTCLPVRTRPPARHARAGRQGSLPSPVRCTASIGTSSARGAVCLVASGQWSTLPGACPGPDTCETGPGRRMGPIPMKSEGRVRVSCGGSGATGAGDATPAKWPRPLVMNRSATSGSLSFLPRNPRSLNHAGPISTHPLLPPFQSR